MVYSRFSTRFATLVSGYFVLIISVVNIIKTVIVGQYVDYVLKEADDPNEDQDLKEGLQIMKTFVHYVLVAEGVMRACNVIVSAVMLYGAYKDKATILFVWVGYVISLICLDILGLVLVLALKAKLTEGMSVDRDDVYRMCYAVVFFVCVYVVSLRARMVRDEKKGCKEVGNEYIQDEKNKWNFVHSSNEYTKA